jgi:cellulose synthase/poly-beta-1,6-N-acetylglucosamine synthase-like glycosyltransferase
MTISVIVPTFRRPANLLSCLEGLKRQRLRPLEVLVALRDDDVATRAALQTWNADGMRVQLVSAGLLGASEARNRCLDQASGDLIALTDDDTIPRPDWLERIHQWFSTDARVGGIGGPDWINGRETPPESRSEFVGRVQWWGRRVGNHHNGSREVMTVEWLKGANMAFRHEALQGIRFGRHLRGAEAQYGEDLGVSLEVAARGWKLVYDPAVAVDHYPGTLPGVCDHRTLTDVLSLAHASHNETVILVAYLRPLRRLAFLLWSTFIGTRLMPGSLMALYTMAAKRRPEVLSRSRVVLRGRLAGWRTWWSTRRTLPVAHPAPAAEAREPATSL